MQKITKIVALGLMMVILAACGGTKQESRGEKEGLNPQEIIKNELEIPVERYIGSVVDYIEQEEAINLFDMGLRAAKMKTDLRNNKELITVFAPTNAAFGKIEDGRKLNAILADIEQVTPLMEGHVVLLGYDLNDFNNENVQTKAKTMLNVSGTKQKPMVEGANVIKAIQANDGFVYHIDSVIGMGDMEAKEVEASAEVEKKKE